MSDPSGSNSEFASPPPEVEIRPIRPDDAARLQAFHLRLSRRSARLRFFTTFPILPDEMARKFADVDFTARAAFVAGAGGTDDIHGVARYELLEPGLAEIAVVVEDAFQRRGVARLLLRELIAWARTQEIRTLRALLLTENQGMLGLLRDSGYPMTSRTNREVRTVDLTIDEGNAT